MGPVEWLSKTLYLFASRSSRTQAEFSKCEIRSTKSETNSKSQFSNVQNDTDLIDQ